MQYWVWSLGSETANSSQLITCPSKGPSSCEWLPENNRMIEVSWATLHCGLCVAWSYLIVHLFERDTSLHVIGSEAISCLGRVRIIDYLSPYNWPPTLDHGQPHQQLSCNPIVEVYTHVHTTDTTKHLLHMYVHTTWHCTFTQAYLGVDAYTKHVANDYKLVCLSTIIFRACKCEIFSQCQQIDGYPPLHFYQAALCCNISAVPVRASRWSELGVTMICRLSLIRHNWAINNWIRTAWGEWIYKIIETINAV